MTTKDQLKNEAKDQIFEIKALEMKIDTQDKKLENCLNGLLRLDDQNSKLEK